MTSRQSAVRHKITGRVVKGAGYGRKIGFPTANLDRRQFIRSSMRGKIKLGVYAGYAHMANKKYAAGIVIGPIDQKGLPRLEAHLLGYKGNLYGRRMELNLIKYIRPFKVYKSEAQLMAAIKKDFILIKRVLKERK
ncbi:riboflavin kinase [Patescibacteria group bacterium]|nr:riboflavin kinase [Patescibacteria group bacterium]